MPEPADFPRRGRAAQLMGRSAECAVLDRLLEAVRAGESRVLVVHDEAGVGKTALLDYLAGQASDCWASPATCWRRWGPTGSPNGPGASCGPPARPPASARPALASWLSGGRYRHGLSYLRGPVR